MHDPDRFLKRSCPKNVSEVRLGHPRAKGKETMHPIFARCTGLTAYGNPCKHWATTDGVCSAHVKPVKPRKRPSPVEAECPICLEEYLSVASAKCGHRACATCCRGMLATGRTLTCPMCRDDRFGLLVKRLAT